MDCIKCLRPYNLRQRRPRSLPCGHSVCSVCLPRLSECPHHQEIPIPQPKNVPHNLALEELLGCCVKHKNSTAKKNKSSPNRKSKKASRRAEGQRRSKIEKRSSASPLKKSPVQQKPSKSRAANNKSSSIPRIEVKVIRSVVEPRVVASLPMKMSPAKRRKKIAGYVKKMHSPSEKVAYEATVCLRKALTVESQPPIAEVVTAGAIPRLVTMLSDKSVPLKFEAAWCITNIASGNSEQVRALVEAGASKPLVDLLSDPCNEVAEQAVWALGNIAGDTFEFRDMLLNLGVMDPLLKLLSADATINMHRYATWTLSNLFRKRGVKDIEVCRAALRVLNRLVFSEDEDVLKDTCWAFSYISDGGNAFIDEVVQRGVTKRLVMLLSHESDQVCTPVLRTIGNLVAGNDEHTQAVLDSGLMNHMKPLLRNPRKNIRKEACWTLSNTTAGNRAQIDIVMNSGVVPILVGILESDQFEVQKEAAWALSNVTAGGSVDHIQFLVDAGCVPHFCALLDAPDARVVSVCLEGLSKIATVGCRSDDETIVGIVREYGLEKIRLLKENHEKLSVRELSSRLLKLLK